MGDGEWRNISAALAKSRDAMVVPFNVVVVHGRIRGKYPVWIAVCVSVVGIGAEADLGGAWVFLAIKLLGQCVELVLCAAFG